MKKHLLVVVLTAILSVSSFAQVKIGYMNPSLALIELDEVLSIEQEIQTLIETRDQDLIAKSAQLQQDLVTYEEGKGVLSAEARATKEQELITRNTELEQERESYLNEIRQRRATMMAPVLEKLDLAIKSVATEMGLDLVLNESTAYGDAIVYFANDERLNITTQVVAKLKAE